MPAVEECSSRMRMCSDHRENTTYSFGCSPSAPYGGGNVGVGKSELNQCSERFITICLQLRRLNRRDCKGKMRLSCRHTESPARTHRLYFFKSSRYSTQRPSKYVICVLFLLKPSLTNEGTDFPPK